MTMHGTKHKDLQDIIFRISYVKYVLEDHSIRITYVSIVRIIILNFHLISNWLLTLQEYMYSPPSNV